MRRVHRWCLSAVMGVTLVPLSSFFLSPQHHALDFRFPYEKMGLSERQAAAHLLSRFTYGPTPDQVDAVVKMGLENWFDEQLHAAIPDDTVTQLLSRYDGLTLSNAEIVKTFPKAGQVRRMAAKEGILDKDSLKNNTDKKEYRRQLKAYMDQRGLKPEQDLIRQFISQKIVRALYSKNQLQEVLTEFWFNHFNVSFSKGDCGQFVPAYERDVIRPNALTDFESLLIATAKSPAMLMYLDNFSSTGTNSQLQMRAKKASNKKGQPKKGMKGLNENYAREVMELHTLGVDGGYTQHDVTEAARVLTGWTVYPMTRDNAMSKMLERTDRGKVSAKGFVHDGDFLFTPNRHDDGEKIVLGKKFHGSGYDEGIQLLKMLAHHPSTANFISRKIAVRFINDNPSPNIIKAMATSFLNHDGDFKQILITMVTSDEFWNDSAVREKTKSPFELAISAIRGLHAKVNQPFQISGWVTRMGQKMYYYQAPTGFPDKGQYWINTGSLLTRMNFGLALAAGKIPGVKFDLLSLNNNHEPESATQALLIYAKLMIPERSTDATVRRLTPLLTDPQLQKKIDQAAVQSENEMPMKDASLEMDPSKTIDSTSNQITDTRMLRSEKENQPGYTLSQVIGILIGSPEFQRR